MLLEPYDKDLGNHCIEMISSLLPENPVVAVDIGQTQCWSAQSLTLKGNQGRILIGGSYGSMGCGLPYAVGACIAENKKTVYCITGDGRHSDHPDSDADILQRVYQQWRYRNISGAILPGGCGWLLLSADKGNGRIIQGSFFNHSFLCSGVFNDIHALQDVSRWCQLGWNHHFTYSGSLLTGSGHTNWHACIQKENTQWPQKIEKRPPGRYFLLRSLNLLVL